MLTRATTAAFAQCLIVALALTACATASEVDRLDARVDSLEREREQTRAKMADDMAKLERLHKMITEAEETLRKSGADLGIRLERIEQDYPKFKGNIESFDFRVKEVMRDLGIIKKELADRMGWTNIFLPADLPKDKDGLWKAAEERAKADKVTEAKAIFELYEANFPDDPRAPQALVEVGKLLERTGDIDGAIRAYQSVYERHEKTPEAPAATFRIAELLIAKQNCERAKAIFKLIETTAAFKGTQQAIDAKSRGKTVMGECKK